VSYPTAVTMVFLAALAIIVVDVVLRLVLRRVVYVFRAMDRLSAATVGRPR